MLPEACLPYIPMLTLIGFMMAVLIGSCAFTGAIYNRHARNEEARFERLAHEALQPGEPHPYHTPCGMGVEFYMTTTGLAATCCYPSGRPDDYCTGTHVCCDRCIIRDCGIQDAQSGWTV